MSCRVVEVPVGTYVLRFTLHTTPWAGMPWRRTCCLAPDSVGIHFAFTRAWHFARALKNHCKVKKKMLLQCRHSCKFTASSMSSSAAPEWRWRYSAGARSRFRWKLHPSSQTWPLLSTSNRRETAIAKCGNFIFLPKIRMKCKGYFNISVLHCFYRIAASSWDMQEENDWPQKISIKLWEIVTFR